MRTRPLRLLVVASLIAGILAGAIVAVAVPRDAAAPAVARLDVHRTAAPYPAAPGQLGVDVLPGTTRIAVTAADPAGGPAWALRRLSGTFTLPEDVPRSHIGKEMFGRKDCLELGRLVGGRFGWLDGSGTFRPADAGRQGVPRVCHAHGAPRSDDGDDASWLTWVSHPDFGEPQPLATVVWGAGEPGDRAITVRSGAEQTDVHRAPDGAFLAFLPASGHEPTGLHVTATDAAGHQHRLYRRFLPLPSTTPKFAAPARLMARAPDPAGGASWGIAAARGVDGRWCATNPGRVVGGGVGQLDERLDLFSDQASFTYSCPPSRDRPAKFQVMTRKAPLMYVFTAGGVSGMERPGGSPGRIALRTEPGATVFAGLARPDVRTITVVSPSQTKIVRPSGPAHAFVVAFEGSFPSGRIRFVSTFADGSTAVQGDHTDDVS